MLERRFMIKSKSNLKSFSNLFRMSLCALVSLFTLSPLASPWSDSLKNAIVNNDPVTIFRLSKNIEADCNFISLYPDLDEASQLQMMQVLLQGAVSLSTKRKAEFSEILTQILDQNSASSKLKAAVLSNLPLFPGVAEEKSYYRFIASPDSLLKSAAYTGLGKKIRLNKDAKKSSNNQKIFKTLTQAGGSNSDLDQIRIIATMGEKYSRDYLLSLFQNDSEKMALIQTYDEDLALANSKIKAQAK